MLVIILIAVFQILSFQYNSYAADKITQETKGNQSPVVYSPGGTVNIYYDKKKDDEVLDREFEKQVQNAPLGVAERARDYYRSGNQALADPSPRYKDAADYYQKSINEYATKPAYSKLIYCLLSMQDFHGAIDAIKDTARLVKERDIQAYGEFFKDQDDEFLIAYLTEVVANIEKEKGEFVLFGLFEYRDDPGLWQIAYSAEWFIPGKDDSYVVRKVANMLQGKPQWRKVEFKSFESLKISENFVQTVLNYLEQTGHLGRLIFWTNTSGFYKRIYIYLHINQRMATADKRCPSYIME